MSDSGASDLPSRLDRRRIAFRSARDRDSKFRIEELAVDPRATAPAAAIAATEEHRPALERLAERVRRARDRGAPVVICHGAHLIKNGLGPVLAELVEGGWLTHVATNGAGSIHDWEFGWMGRSCEDVRAYVAEGQFGIWEETGSTLGLSIALGAVEGLGYGRSVGRTMVEEALEVPSRAELLARLARSVGEERAAVADVLTLLEDGLEPGRRVMPHPFARYSLQARCYRAGVPFTVHPGIGQDIIYTHPHFTGGAVGRASMTDFLVYADAIRRLPGGVYISAGSSVMSPMIFEKSVSMARNLARQAVEGYEDFFIAVNDLAESSWDWSRGEPPIDDPAYYVRFMKSFSRMGGELGYFGMDNRVFLLALHALLCR